MSAKAKGTFELTYQEWILSARQEDHRNRVHGHDRRRHRLLHSAVPRPDFRNLFLARVGVEGVPGLVDQGSMDYLEGHSCTLLVVPVNLKNNYFFATKNVKLLLELTETSPAKDNAEMKKKRCKFFSLILCK